MIEQTWTDQPAKYGCVSHRCKHRKSIQMGLDTACGQRITPWSYPLPKYLGFHDPWCEQWYTNSMVANLNNPVTWQLWNYSRKHMRLEKDYAISDESSYCVQQLHMYAVKTPSNRLEMSNEGRLQNWLQQLVCGIQLTVTVIIRKQQLTIRCTIGVVIWTPSGK